MSFLKRLFGLGSGEPESAAAAPKTIAEAEHNGFRIFAEPYKEGGQYQLAGRIVKDVGGVTKEHRFVRADRFASIDEAANLALQKGRKIIDERGDKMFD
ncbi:MAG: HlyU family transcriptional regulator [Hyphomicrobiales bacterium]